MARRILSFRSTRATGVARPPRPAGAGGRSRLARLPRWVAGAALLVASAGCTTTSLVLGVAGVATDTSITWEIAKHLHAKASEGMPVACVRLNSVERALTPRCGAFVEGSLRAEDITRHELPGCPLSLAARDPRLWPVLPELVAKGAQPESCAVPPMLALAAVPACPPFDGASPEVLNAIAFLAEGDPRAVRPDVVRALSCPTARQAGLSRVLDHWLDAGLLQRDSVGFGVLGALHPDHLVSPFGRRLETQGHTAAASLGGHEGRHTPGFEEALRLGHVEALQWWFNRAPQLANRVPPTQAGRVAWAPLARVLLPGFLADPSRQTDMVNFLLARGADPWKPVPGGVHPSVVAYARDLRSPHVVLLDPPIAPPPATPSALPPVARVPALAPIADVAANQGH